VGGGKGGPVEVDVLEKFYQATKDALIEAKNEVSHALKVGSSGVLIGLYSAEALGENESETRETLAR
jgi:hypothetical protein